MGALEWFSVDIDRALDPDFLGLPAEVRGHYFALLALAHRERRGGVIVGCREWSRRQWDRAAAMTISSVDRVVSAGLARWVDLPASSLEVSGYDHRGEKKAKSKSEQTRNAALRRWRGTADASAPHSDRNADGVIHRCVPDAHTDRQTDIPGICERKPSASIPPPEVPVDWETQDDGRPAPSTASAFGSFLADRTRAS